jgi:redox-sensitive bicupin YhaK (pirin superfamily)
MREDGLTLRVIAGAMHGLRSPVSTLWDTIFAEVRLAAGTVLPLGTEYEERALYVISGEIEIGGYRHPSQQLLVLKPGDRTEVKALEDAHFVLVGGAAMDGPRHIWWNFVSSRQDRIEAAKADWKTGRFAVVPGDSTEFIPLPDGA